MVTLLKFPVDDAKAFHESVGCLSTAHVHELAHDSAGCRVLEAFMESDGGPAMKADMMWRFDGHFGELALMNHGSFLIARSFRQIEALPLKEKIVQQLSSVRARLERTPRGPTLLSQCGVYEYESDAHGWRVSMRNKDKMLNEFTSMFEDVARKNSNRGRDGGTQNGVDQGADGGKRKRKKRRKNNRD